MVLLIGLVWCVVRYGTVWVWVWVQIFVWSSDKHGRIAVSGQVRRENVADALSLEAHCTLHFYFAPHLAAFKKLLNAFGYPEMTWDTSTKGFTKCPLRQPPHSARADRPPLARVLRRTGPVLSGWIYLLTASLTRSGLTRGPAWWAGWRRRRSSTRRRPVRRPRSSNPSRRSVCRLQPRRRRLARRPTQRRRRGQV